MARDTPEEPVGGGAGSATHKQPARGSVRDALRAAIERRALAVLGVATAAILVVTFYLPVGLAFAAAVQVDGRLTLSAFATVLTDPFYVGVLAGVLERPLAVGRHAGNVAAWIGAGFPPLRLGLFGFTAYQAALSTVASVALGLPGAYVLSRFEFRGRRLLRSVTIVPFVLPGIMVAIGFFATFGAGGTVNRLLAALSLPTVDLVGTLTIVILAHAFYNAPLVARVTTAAWENVDVRTVETARSLGAAPRRAFIDVVAPQLVPAILTGALLTFIFTFMTFPIVLALGGLRLATVEVWVFDRVRNLQYTEAAVLAILETGVSLTLTYAYLRYERRQARRTGEGRPPTREPLVPSLRALVTPRRLGVMAYGVLVAVLFLGPLASMVLAGLTVDGRFTLRHYEFLLQRQTAGAAFQTKPLPAIANSLSFAAATVAVALPMGVVTAVVTTGSSVAGTGGDGGAGRTRLLADGLAMAPLAVSGIVFGIGLLQGLVFGIPLFGGWRLQLTGPVAIVIAHAVAAYPFVIRNVAPQLASIDRAMVESARALGASRVRALIDVELPLVATGVAAGAAFAFAISIGEFDSTVILATGTDAYTMPVAVERYLGRRSGPAMAMGTVLLLVTAVSFAVVDRLGGRFERG